MINRTWTEENPYASHSPTRPRSQLGISRASFTSSRSSSIKRRPVTHQQSFANRTMAEENLQNLNARRREASLPQQDLELRLGEPQRIELPVYFNTPHRNERLIEPRKLTSKSPSKTLKKVLVRNSSSLRMCYKDSADRLAAQRRLKDYKILGFACKRAGKSRDEGRAYYSEGVLFDNLGKFKLAIQKYKQFLTVCKQIGDVHGTALAYNCIGVDYQKLGESDPAYLEQALVYHQKHREVADVAGKFLAHINIGLIQDKLGNMGEAQMNHQFALRYAIQMSSVAGQSLAIGNMGKVGQEAKKTELRGDKMETFVARYLELSNELRDRHGEKGGYLQMGKILTEKGEFRDGSRHLMTAMRMASEVGDVEAEKEAKCTYGIATGHINWAGKQREMEERMKEILAKQI